MLPGGVVHQTGETGHEKKPLFEVAPFGFGKFGRKFAAIDIRDNRSSMLLRNGHDVTKSRFISVGIFHK